MRTLIIAASVLLPFIILANVALFHLLVKTAIRRIVKPELEKRNLTYVSYKWAGFWSCGDFRNDSMDFALFKTGLNTISIYSYVYYKDSDEIKKITIKIYIVGVGVNKVEYSNTI